ncbi:hypothetical protein [Streptomyces sp. LN785]|uniref:hypothetical protein n=1 Tax=Streptomyces sp. LN785 TaxID=3112983 RepID=UPI00371E7B0E
MPHRLRGVPALEERTVGAANHGAHGDLAPAIASIGDGDHRAGLPAGASQRGEHSRQGAPTGFAVCSLVDDSTKLGKRAFAQVCAVTAIAVLMTDKDAPDELVERFTAQGVEVQCV